MVGVKGKSGRKITAESPWGPLYESVGGQAKLAEKLGVSKATVGNWATEVHRIPEMARREVMRLCKYYGINEGLHKLERQENI